MDHSAGFGFGARCGKEREATADRKCGSPEFEVGEILVKFLLSIGSRSRASFNLTKLCVTHRNVGAMADAVKLSGSIATANGVLSPA
jgi:hypothetical protein